MHRYTHIHCTPTHTYTHQIWRHVHNAYTGTRAPSIYTRLCMYLAPPTPREDGGRAPSPREPGPSKRGHGTAGRRGLPLQANPTPCCFLQGHHMGIGCPCFVLFVTISWGPGALGSTSSRSRKNKKMSRSPAPSARAPRSSTSERAAEEPERSLARLFIFRRGLLFKRWKVLGKLHEGRSKRRKFEESRGE